MTSPTITVTTILTTLLLGASAVRGAMPSEYKCNGNEPFWGLAIEGKHAGWATPEEPEGRTLEGTFLHLDYAGLFSWRGGFGEGDLVAFVTRRPCSDTMADRDYPFSISVSLPDGSVLLGCCDTTSKSSTEGSSESSRVDVDEPQAQDFDESLVDSPIAILDEKPPGDWSRDLFDLLPAIKGCVARTPGSSPRVVKAWSTTKGEVGVRTWNAEATGFECVATGQGSVVQPLIPLAGDAMGLHDSWSPIFTPGNLLPPVGECYQHERVVGVNGDLIGWLSYDTC